MKRKTGRKLTVGILLILLLAVVCNIGAAAAEGCSVEPCLSARGTAEIRFRIPGILFPGEGTCDQAAPSDLTPPERKLIPGGGVFGIRIACDGVLVVGFREGGSVGFDAGLRPGDLIVAVDQKKIGSAFYLMTNGILFF